MADELEYCRWCDGEIDGDGRHGLCEFCQDIYIRKLMKKIKSNEDDLKIYGVEITWNNR